MARDAADLTVYQRTAIYVVPKFDIKFSARAKRLFARVPLSQRIIRAVTDFVYEVLVDWGILHYSRFPLGNRAAAYLSKVWRFAVIRDKELRRKLTPPDYAFGCKRPTFSNKFYRAFTRPNVYLQSSGIDHIEADGIVANDGTKSVIDTLVLATGFDLWEANFPAIEVIGRDGRNLGKWWRENPIPGLSRRIGSVLPPQLLEPGQSVRVPRLELLQLDGISDAAHGPAVRRTEATGGQPRSRSPKKPTPAIWTR